MSSSLLKTSFLTRFLFFHTKILAPAKRSQHVNATYRNIVGRNMLCSFGYRVAMCCDRHFGCCWLKFENSHIRANNTQHVATGWLNACKMLRPTMLRYVGLTCCDRLAGALLAQISPFSNLSQQHPTCRNTSQHGGQTQAACCAQQCCDMLRWYFANFWPGLFSFEKKENVLKTEVGFKYLEFNNVL